VEKLAKLIRDLKAQEKAYVDFVQRNIVSVFTFYIIFVRNVKIFVSQGIIT
jgi:hypothetical protein